jgi:hypothetical protein
MYVSTAMRAQLRKPGACGVFSLQVKYDPASRLKCTATLIIDDILYSRKSCHALYDEYEFRTVKIMFINTCKVKKTTLMHLANVNYYIPTPPRLTKQR